MNLRHALRLLRRSPGFTVTVLLTLGIGIGANTAIFSFADALLFRPLPYPDADRVVMVWQDYAANGGPSREWFTPPDYGDLKERTRSFSAVSLIQGWAPNLTGAGEPEVLRGGTVGWGYFAVAGAAAGLGRVFTVDDEAGDPRVVVLGHGLWQRRFGGDSTIVGGSIQLNDESWTVVGVMADDFVPPYADAELWRPRGAASFGAGCARSCYVMRVVARIRPDMTLAAAREEMRAFSARLRESYSAEKAGLEIVLMPLAEELAGPVRRPLFVLLVAVGMLLLMACANIANLLIARAGAREREVAVRAALGARPRTILRQLLGESVLLGLMGGAVGTVFALWGVSLLRGMSPSGTPRLAGVGVDLRALGFAFVLSVTTGIVFGLVPAIRAARTDLSRSMKDAVGLRSGRTQRTRSALVAVEVAMALMLLVGAGLLARSLLRIRAVDAGFRAENALAVDLRLPSARYPDVASSSVFFEELLDRIRARPGIVAAGATSIAPLSGSNTDTGFLIEGNPLPRDRSEASVAWYRAVTAGYFQAIGMRILRGRGIEPTDRADTRLIAVINETMAARYWPGEDPIGQRITTVSAEGPWIEIVGIVADVRHEGLDRPPLVEMYLPYEQIPERPATVVVRTAGPPLDAVPLVRAEVRALDPALPLARITTMEEVVRQSIALPRLFTAFLGFFAVVAIALAAIGIYGVTSYAIAQRTQEIGVRMALGAGPRAVANLVLRHAVVPAALGLALGLLAAWGLSRYLSTLLYDLSPTDAVTYAVLTLLLGAIAALAGYLPARRATRVDPLRALRME